MDAKPVRRIVTGHDAEGKSVILEDGAPSRTVQVGGERGAWFHELWNTRATPAPIDRASGEPHEDGITLPPPAGGTRIRIVDFPPDDGRLEGITPEIARAHFASIGATGASTHDENSRHPFMHRTETIDYGIVLEGEIVLIVDEKETLVCTGDVVIQRGTNHGWANRSGDNCRVAFILIDGTFEEGLG